MLDLECKCGILKKEKIAIIVNVKPEGEVFMGQKEIGIDYKILISGGEGEIVEKKSRFIATIRVVESEEEAQAFIGEMKKKYWDARHNCSAFVIGAGGELTRCSDDGEPSGTAGRPMLEVLIGSEIRNIAVVVTRYFGGILLGTGGLVRAYTQAVQEGIRNCETAMMRFGVRYRLVTDYNGIGKILYILSEQGIEQEQSEYGENVTLQVIAPIKEAELLVKSITEATGGRTEITELERTYFIDKKDAF